MSLSLKFPQVTAELSVSAQAAAHTPSSPPFSLPLPGADDVPRSSEEARARWLLVVSELCISACRLTHRLLFYLH